MAENAPDRQSMIRRLPLAALVAVCAVAGVAGVFAGGARAHRDPCHLHHICPSDHHTYPWHGLYCTSYADERLPSDTKTVVYEGRTYWCHGSSSAGGSPPPPASGSGAACGVERWSVKTMNETTAHLVNMRARPTTITALRALQPPPQLPASTRIGPVETTRWQIHARLVSFKIESDSDVHLVVADPTSGGSMIIEFPAASCVGAKAPAKARQLMKNARAALIRSCGSPNSSSFTGLSGTAVINGVGFFDFKHGQRGVAPNAIELHPALGFSSSNCG
jgi:hypothetical protein